MQTHNNRNQPSQSTSNGSMLVAQRCLAKSRALRRTEGARDQFQFVTATRHRFGSLDGRRRRWSWRKGLWWTRIGSSLQRKRQIKILIVEERCVAKAPHYPVRHLACFDLNAGNSDGRVCHAHVPFRFQCVKHFLKKKTKTKLKIKNI